PPPNHACIARPVSQDQKFYELGVRVPMVAISPYARPGYVSHVVEEHTAITRFIETVFDLPALTARDANSGGLLDLFDFRCPPSLLTPPAAPDGGTHGCFGSIVLTTDKTVYAPGDTIQISWTGGPGNEAKDWIGVFPSGTQPMMSSFAWEYIGGTQSVGVLSASGTVTIDMTSLGSAGTWPFPVGQYSAYYLLDGAYTPAASIDFT